MTGEPGPERGLLSPCGPQRAGNSEVPGVKGSRPEAEAVRPAEPVTSTASSVSLQGLPGGTCPPRQAVAVSLDMSTPEKALACIVPSMAADPDGHHALRAHSAHGTASLRVESESLLQESWSQEGETKIGTPRKSTVKKMTKPPQNNLSNENGKRFLKNCTNKNEAEKQPKNERCLGK